MKKYIIPFIAALMSLGMASCTADYVWRNTNEEQASNEDLTHDGNLAGSYISQMISNVLPSYQNDGENEYGSASYQVVQGLTGNIFANYEAASNSGFHQTNEYNLIADGWTKALFEDAFVRAIAPWTELNAFRSENPQAAAWADILKVAALHRVTDAYGPIPYSQIGTGAEHLEYDSQQEVYNGMFKDLDSAIEILTKFVKDLDGEPFMGRFDNVFYGDMKKWVQFANTLRLRLALRVAYVAPTLYNQQAEAALANELGLLEEDAKLHPGTAKWENPLYVIEYNFNDGDAKAGATIITYMNGYSDPRRSAYFTAGDDGNYYGVRMGATVDSNYPKSTKWSRIRCTNNDPLLWMSGAESFFLKAEHYLRQNNTAQAKIAYEDGVRKSFEIWGVSIGSYLSTTKGVGSYTDPVTSGNSWSTALTGTSVMWTSQSSTEGHLEQIITQKYLAMFPEGMEAWAEFRRTGYPKVIPTATNNSNGSIDSNIQIRRLIYPASEAQANNANLQEGIQLLDEEAALGSGDKGGTSVWWDKKAK